MRSLTFASPAKLNLHLIVTGRRKDGYHSLATLFHRISLKDMLRLSKKESGFSLQVSDPNLPSGETNLITRAYRMLQAKFPKLGGVRVRLNKKIPVGGGLGGGSSNAATFLLGMNRLYDLRLSRKELVSLGKRLGADVPFFLFQVNQAVGRGRGDEIFSRPSRRRLWFLLVLSQKGVNTKKVYHGLSRRLPRVSLTKATRAVTMVSDFLDGKQFPLGIKLLRNDLESPARRLRPSIGRTLKKLKSLGLEAVRMSGSGPTIFAVLSHRQEARQLARKVRKHFRRQRIVICHSF